MLWEVWFCRWLYRGDEQQYMCEMMCAEAGVFGRGVMMTMMV